MIPYIDYVEIRHCSKWSEEVMHLATSRIHISP